MGERLGVRVRIQNIESRILNLEWGDGALIQLPVEDMSILKQIPIEKDVDGLNEESGFLPAAVVAVERILESRILNLESSKMRIAVVGARGFIGKRLESRIKSQEWDVTGLDKGDDLDRLVDFDVVISATGVAGLIKKEMVKTGMVAIDLGFPKGDFASDVAGKAGFFTPVPGGVGPVTIACLYENLALV